MGDFPAIEFAKGEHPHRLLLGLGNRHGLIAGATGTGKTVSLKVLAEGFSRAGVPVFVADVKGDLAGLAQPGTPDPKLADRAKQLGLCELAFAPCPTVFWDLYGQQGYPIRTAIAEMGPLLLSRLLQLNETQEGVLNIAFKAADEEGLLLLDLKDLQALLAFMAENAAQFSGTYGNVSKASVGAIQRQLLVLEQQGGEDFFGEPALDLHDFLRTTSDGRGVVNILAADKLIQSPRLYATFLLWMLSELFEALPEVGDPEKPRLVFFFDEAHLLFDDAPKALTEKVEQVVRLIRSKGVGVYFVTQNPIDVPDRVLGQLGHRIQHALRAFTPRDQKALKACADTFRSDKGFDVVRALQELGVGEALVSVLDEKGIPEVVERAFIYPPVSRMGPITPEERKAAIAAGGLALKYATTVDRESAYEKLTARAAERQAGGEQPKAEKTASRGRSRDNFGESVFKSVARSTGSSLGTQIGRSVAKSLGGSGAVATVGGSIGRAVIRGILGSILGER
ncbi:helicase HerA-like domain-containing protein [Dongia soli]|uniref:Helicase HerA-like domain-containing protein n=1 Tax=Dongia soli TaxID=600628 RepID=A0ABU5EBG5_9PROT|nr:helicase HerA-like domain-containing protein [Dongia soli]MDY0883399.1 helicase HerA-like domain-containing protein [Dongia soli]